TTKGDDGKSDTDSNANPTTSCTDPVTLISGENNPTMDVGIVIISPQAVKLTAFTATASNGGVKVTWTTGSEINTFGFALYRAATNERASAVLVTTELIPAKGASSYAYLDATAAPDTKYSYWLIEAETSGAMNEYGPLQTDAPRGVGTDGTDKADVSVVVQPNVAVVAGGVPLAVPSASAPVAAEVAVLQAPSNAPAQSAVQVMAQVAAQDAQAVASEVKQQVREEAPAVESVAEVPEMSAASLSTPVEASEAKTVQEPVVPVVEQAVVEQPMVVDAPAVEVEPQQVVVAVGEAPSVETKPVASQRPTIGVMWIVMGLALLGFILTMILGVCLVALAKRSRA
ncbi:MAG: hypothetical protein HC853_14620, partial [Anaerolineae bacterium]|nr:hypothetical protein [Anaerolineae bacterium]